MTKNVMIDLETLGTYPGCAILSIGAVTFGPSGAGEDQFYAIVDRRTCRAAGLREDPETLSWWERQSTQARAILVQAYDPAIAMELSSVLANLKLWLDVVSDNGRETVLVWGNGADFDNAILKAIYLRCGYRQPPWGAFNDRCYRTLKNMRPTITLERDENGKHNALADALYQANHAVKLLNDLWGIW